jgi:hypothetical protein
MRVYRGESWGGNSVDARCLSSRLGAENTKCLIRAGSSAGGA